jgi:predicted alpha/beta superfamily hydrolase
MATCVVTFRLTASTTPKGQRVFLVGSHNDWKLAQKSGLMHEVSPGQFELKLELPVGSQLAYKFNRGSWLTVEVDGRGIENENRLLRVVGDQVVEHVVPHWRDQASRATPRRLRGTDVTVLPPMPIPALGRSREVVVYLPPQYHERPDERYPVLYLFDGQNLFDASTAFNMEWCVDETCDRLIAEGKLAPLIVVGIYNGGEHRVSEQSPWRDQRFGARGEGHAFMRWVSGDLKSYIDTHYRSLSEPEHTAIGGSSLGGLTALFAAYRYPLIFGKVAALSPAFWFARSQIFRYVASQSPPRARVYLDCGELETARVHPKRDFYKVAASMVDLLKQQGFEEGVNLRWVSDPKGTHSEQCWARRVGGALQFLFPGNSELRPRQPGSMTLRIR